MVLLGVLDGGADLPIGQTLPDHGHVGRRQTPVGRARRHMLAREIVILMAGATLLCRHAVGSRRIRLPVAANTALQMAGAAQGTPGSPIPPDFSVLSTR